jgi:DUF1365 family protein
MNSAFYFGVVSHKRFDQKKHGFNYSQYMLFLDTREIEEIEKLNWWFSTRHWAPLQLKRSDYFNSFPQRESRADENTGDYLKRTVIAAALSLGAKVENINRVCLLVQTRCFGVYFSPINFFFLYQDQSAKYLVAEVSNTPWNEKYYYLVDINSPQPVAKSFHVSPFMEMDMTYHWQITPPAETTKIRIDNWDKKRLFTAVFSARRKGLTKQNIRSVLARWPVQPISVIGRIYWQAFKLFLKGVRFVPYQKKPPLNQSDAK